MFEIRLQALVTVKEGNYDVVILDGMAFLSEYNLGKLSQITVCVTTT